MACKSNERQRRKKVLIDIANKMTKEFGIIYVVYKDDSDYYIETKETAKANKINYIYETRHI